MKKIFTTIVICSSLLASSASAATIDSVVLSDLNNSMMTVTGTLSEGEKGVNIIVLPKGQTLNVGYLSGSDSSIQNATINENKYTATFKFDANAGWYDVYASNCQNSYPFEYILKSEVLQFVEDLGNKLISESELYGKLAKYSGSVGADIAFADTQEKQEYLVDNILEYAERIKDNGISGIRTVVALTNAELEFMDKLKEASAPSSVNTLLMEYGASAEIDLTEFNKLSNDDKVQICLAFVEASYSDMKLFRSDFNGKVSPSNTNQGVIVNPGSVSSGSLSVGGVSGSASFAPVITTDSEPDSAPGAKLFDMFDDLSNVEWAWEPILYMVDNGIMSGMGNGKFAPNNNLKREQLAKILTLGMGMYDNSCISDFDDVSEDHWSSSYVGSAKKNGIMKGIGGNNFGLGRDISREELCVAIYRCALMHGMEFENEKTDFNDFGEISDYAKEAVSRMAGSGIISGMGDGRFAPKSPATRAQAAKIIYAVLTR